MLELNKIYNMDCLEGMKQIPSNSIDAIVTDPPFSFGINSSCANQKLDGWNDLMNGAFFFKEVFEECLRISKKDSVYWVFNSWRSYPCLLKSLSMVGLGVNSLMVWNKDWIGPGGPKGLRPSYEVVALICNGEFAIPNRGIPDIKTVKWASHKPHHPAEKPLDLIRWLIEISGTVKTILDPFMGSGTTAVACKQLGREYIGFEVNPKYHEVACKRIANVPSKLELYEPNIIIKNQTKLVT